MGSGGSNNVERGVQRGSSNRASSFKLKQAPVIELGVDADGGSESDESLKSLSSDDSGDEEERTVERTGKEKGKGTTGLTEGVAQLSDSKTIGTPPSGTGCGCNIS